MATTTPNFGWAVPTSTDLVKDGAVAIETLGDSIDASLVDLKGGTTGQVLAKASATDMDFAWATPSAGSSNVAGKNGVLNSNMTIWQRGTSNTGGGYTADRFAAYQASSLFVTSRQTASLTGFQFCLRNQRPSGNTNTGISYIYQDFESINSTIYQGQTVAFSFYARAGANFSASGSGLVARVISGTGTDQNSVLAGYTSQTNVINQTATLTTSWQRFTYTGTVGSSINQIGLNFLWTPTGTAGAADFVEITGVQLEIAASATAYSPNAATFQGELAACQRYYVRFNAQDAYQPFGFGTGTSTTASQQVVSVPSTMRVVPTTLDYSNIGLINNFGAGAYGITTATISRSGLNQAVIAGTVASGLTQGTFYYLCANNNAAAFIGFGAEL